MSVTWSCSCFSRSTALTRATSAIWSIGLVRYSSAPASSPATTSLESALAVHRMIGMNGIVASLLSRLQTSMPSIFGIMMSSRIRSGSCSLAAASASSPSAACLSS